MLRSAATASAGRLRRSLSTPRRGGVGTRRGATPLRASTRAIDSTSRQSTETNAVKTSRAGARSRRPRQKPLSDRESKVFDSWDDGPGPPCVDGRQRRRSTWPARY